MQDPYAKLLEQLRQSVLEGNGSTEPALRQAAASNEALPPELAKYVNKIAKHAYKVTDEDLAELVKAGYTENQLFEITISAALGSGLTRLQAGLKAVKEESSSDALKSS